MKRHITQKSKSQGHLKLHHMITCLHSGNAIHEYSPNTRDYGRLQLVPREPVSFQLPLSVRACTDAHVTLLLAAETDNEVEVVFGSDGNSQSEIRRGAECKDSTITTDMLSDSR